MGGEGADQRGAARTAQEKSPKWGKQGRNRNGTFKGAGQHKGQGGGDMGVHEPKWGGGPSGCGRTSTMGTGQTSLIEDGKKVIKKSIAPPNLLANQTWPRDPPKGATKRLGGVNQ